MTRGENGQEPDSEMHGSMDGLIGDFAAEGDPSEAVEPAAHELVGLFEDSSDESEPIPASASRTYDDGWFVADVRTVQSEPLPAPGPVPDVEATMTELL
jgi:hypothetical protein